MRTIFALLGLATMLTTAAQAQDSERYRLEKTDRGYVRMDTQTGAMSICEDRETQLVCKSAVMEPGGAAQSSDADLQKRIDQLEIRIAQLESARSMKSTETTEQEFEQGLDFMERFFRRFMGLAREFEREPQPDRT